MIILDTDVMSELMRRERHPSVRAWLRAQSVEALATTTITLAEIGYGLARLPDGRRRFELEASFQTLVTRGLGRRVFDFDARAAQVYGEMVAARDAAGRPFRCFDGLIAAVARSRDATVATRNIAHFEASGVSLVDPWEGENA